MELSANPGEGLLQVLQICQQNLSQALEMTQKQKVEIEEIKTENATLLQKVIQQQEIISELQKKVARNENFTTEIHDLKLVSQSFPKVQNPKVKEIINKEDDFGNTRLHQASRQHNPRLVQRLIELGADINTYNNELSTPLHEAVSGRSSNAEETVKILLQNGAEVNAKKLDGQTPLHDADFQLSTVLIQHGADVRTKDVDLKTPLHGATQRNDLKTVELLIQHGADVNTRDYNQSTPLHIAAIENHRDWSKIVEVLLENGAEVNALDDDSRTPLHYAAKRSSLFHIETLLKHGARKDLKDKYDKTPESYTVNAVIRDALK